MTITQREATAPVQAAGVAWAGWRTVRRHSLFLLVLAAGLVLRVLAETAYRPALLYIDSVKYLEGSVATAPQGYQALLRLLEAGGLALVAAVQHVFGLAMAVALYAVLLRRGAPRWVATLAAAPVLLDAYQLQLEQTIMPDVLFETMIAAGLVVLLWRPGPWSARSAVGRAAARRGGHRAGDRRGADRAGGGVRGAERARAAAAGRGGPRWRPGASCCRCWATWPGHCASPGTSGWPATGRARSTGGRRPRRTAPR